VRFRAAIKEPEELAFLFLAIAIGWAGRRAGPVTVVALAVILALVVVRGLFYRTPEQPNLFVTVTSGTGQVERGQILEALSASGASASLKRFDETPDLLEAAFNVDFHEVGSSSSSRGCAS
jgi:hypothetical protein